MRSSTTLGSQPKIYRKLIRIRKNKFAQTFLNRYRRELETCPQAKTSKSGHAVFFSFFRRVQATSMTQRRVKILASTFGRFRLYRLKVQKNNNPDHDSKKPRRGLETYVENEVMSFACSLLQNNWIN